MGNSEYLAIILIVLTFIFILGFLLYRKRRKGADEQNGEQVWQKKNERLIWDIQYGFNDIVSQSLGFQEQIRIFQTAIGKKLRDLGALEPKTAERFNQNSQTIDKLTDEYSRLTGSLYLLLKEESSITSLELLHSHRLKEFGTIQQLSNLLKQIQPVLKENISIVILS